MSERIVERVARMRVNDEGLLVVRGDDEETGMREEVVRCGDCAHASPAGLDCDPDELYCVVMDWIMSPDGFCSFGERREA